MMLTISPLLTLISLVSLPVSIFAIRPILKRSKNTLLINNGHLDN